MNRPSRNAAPTRLGLADPLGRQLWICALMVILFIGGAYALSRSIKSQTDDKVYLVTKERISFSAPPKWIAEGVLQQIADVLFVDDKPFDVRDRDLTQRIAAAVEAAENPWVQSVERVVKYYPTKVLVDIQYRRPVAMVEVKMKIDDADWGLIPVDSQGVILPGRGNGFLEANRKSFPRINLGGVAPDGTKKPGNEWGDVRITEAARIADSLGSVWSRLNFHRIVAAASEDGHNLYELHTTDGAHLMWGSAPGVERAHENSAAQKIGMLLALQESQIAAGVVDLRTPAELTSTAAPAAR
ncbi:hypothetical protein [Blastopirellula marina]|uniref:POTRA domain-containing protein n=1 Tax=Blastopirellula marina DSM 3645 TaxID=314230 RepID=A3ZZY7_9BACT|nr:hypothetical protein [Blastopirellula marina]EAQ77931.1 hypothetical protein DSM3645_27171 [Blastopirellula marina DSM 3645]